MSLKKQNIDFLFIKGAKEHNLKNISLSIPRNKLTVITGVSGSGKSSLAFDTIFAEGQRKYADSLSNYARQFIEILDKPDVENIEGLSPTIAIQQKTTAIHPKSTVGTVTEIYDYLRILFSKISKARCLSCDTEITSQTINQIADQIWSFSNNTKISLLAPFIRERKGTHQKELEKIQKKGFSKVKIDGKLYDLYEEIKIDKNKKHNIDIYIERLVLRKTEDKKKSPLYQRILKALRLATEISNGMIKCETEKGEVLFSTEAVCPKCNFSLPNPEPMLFSFNSVLGSCEHCHGVGLISFEEFEEAEEAFQEKVCEDCSGARLKKEGLSFLLGNKNIYEVSLFPFRELQTFLKKLKLSDREKIIAERPLKEIFRRLEFLIQVGVEYLTLSRSTKTLSGGESQRVRLATQIGSSLTGVTYVLDEPSIGLHQKDHDKLLSILTHLKDLGNTILVVEHDRDTMLQSDYIIDLGPGAGTHGGEIMAQGTPKEIQKSKTSLTGQYLSGKKKISVTKLTKDSKKTEKKKIKIHSASLNNLKNIDVEFPLESLVCVTGVSGSGKSSLIRGILYPFLMHKIYKSPMPRSEKEKHFKKITGFEHLDKVLHVDQKPIGKTPRSNPATYTGVYTVIRDLFSSLPESKMKNYKPGFFSFNLAGGRCEKCQGAGRVKIEMSFLADTYVLCDECEGKRFQRETLGILYKGKSIADVLQMTIEEAYEFFKNIPMLATKLQVLKDVGLGYITLKQSALHLSGGESQRLKLAKELSKRATGKTLYILDEPTTGLHFEDIQKLIDVLQKLVQQGNTVLVIEHNLDVIQFADYIVDLGPEGGKKGGDVLYQGPLKGILKHKKSFTGKYLQDLLS